MTSVESSLISARRGSGFCATFSLFLTYKVTGICDNASWAFFLHSFITGEQKYVCRLVSTPINSKLLCIRRLLLLPTPCFYDKSCDILFFLKTSGLVFHQNLCFHLKKKSFQLDVGTELEKNMKMFAASPWWQKKPKCIREPPNIVFYFKSNKQKIPNHWVNERPVVLKDRLLMSVLWSFTVTVKVTFVILFIKWWYFFIADKLLAKSLFKKKKCWILWKIWSLYKTKSC